MRRSAVLTRTCILLSSLALTVAVPAADVSWPGWMGPNRDGWVGDFQPPKEWPSQVQPVWQVDVGEGYGSPLVSDGRVYQHSRQGDNEVLWCLDLKTGEERWRQNYSVPFRIGGGGERHGKGPKSSPVMASGRIFTMSITGILSAWDADSGEPLWKADYPSSAERNFPYWGVSTSPLTDGDHVVVHFGTDDAGVLVALDAATGKEVWRLEGDGPSYSSPLLVEIQGVRQIVEWNHEALTGVDSSSGKLLWSYPFPHVGSDQNMPTPVFHQGRVLLGGENRGIVSLEPVRSGDTWTVSRRWHQKAVALNMSSAVINDNLLFGFSHYDSGRLFCLDPETGEVLWKGPPRAGDNVMFLSVPGYVVALNANGQLQVIEATGDKLKIAARWRVSETDTWAPPVLLPNGFLIKDTDKLTRWAW
ncbi:MAG: PQQ-like beta-propeller repeat protein [Fuerstiella sp.]